MFSFIQWPSSVFQVIWIERLNCTRFVTVAYNRAIISLLPRIICGKSQKISLRVTGLTNRIMNPGPPEKKYGNIMFCENYWKHTTCKWLFQNGRQSHTLQHVTAIFHFSLQWKLSRIITVS